MIQDLRYAIRTLRRSPGFTLVAVLALALGIGANTAIFTVVDAVLLRPLPYPHPERVMAFSRQYVRGAGSATSAIKYRFWKEQSTSFEAVAAMDVMGSGASLTGGPEPERVKSARVSSELFRVLGVEPRLGRSFTEQEDQPGAACVAVIADSLWRRRFGADAGIAGRSVTLNGSPCTVLGVMPPGFQMYWTDAEVLTPIRIAGVPRDRANSYRVLARLKPGVTLEAVRAEMQTVFAHFGASNPDLVEDGETGIWIRPFHDWVVGNAGESLWILTGAVGLVLLIACANVANLLLSRATGRVKEMALRAALGAGRSRLIRQWITESVLLALAGGAAGVLLAQSGIGLLLNIAPGNLPRASEIAVDWRVTFYAFLLSALTGLLSGLAPALRSSRVDLNESLKEGASRSSVGPGRARIRSVLIAAEVALSIVLLAGAGLLMRSFVALHSVTLGFDPHNVLALQMSPAERYSTTARMWDFERQALERLRAIPGVEAAATAICLPLESGPDFPTEILGRAQHTIVEPMYRNISPDYFVALRVPLIRGRSFSNADSAGSTPVAVINQTMAQHVFKDRDPLGERILIGVGLGAAADVPRVIVGIAGDMRDWSLDQPPGMTVYVPRAQVPDGLTKFANSAVPMSWAVRTRVPPLQLADSVRRAILAVDPDQPVSDVRTMDQNVTRSPHAARQQFNFLLMGVFAGIAVLLATIGIYGVVSYQVGQRARELGIRVALGATQHQILRMVILQGLKPIAAGIVAGLIAALALTRLIQSLLYQVTPRDPWTLIMIPVLLAAVACLACYVPARRAVQADPVTALHHE